MLGVGPTTPERCSQSMQRPQSQRPCLCACGAFHGGAATTASCGPCGPRAPCLRPHRRSARAAHQSPSKLCAPTSHPNQLTPLKAAGAAFPEPAARTRLPLLSTVSFGSTRLVPAGWSQGDGQARGTRLPLLSTRHAHASAGRGGTGLGTIAAAAAAAAWVAEVWGCGGQRVGWVWLSGRRRGRSCRRGWIAEPLQGRARLPCAHPRAAARSCRPDM